MLNIAVLYYVLHSAYRCARINRYIYSPCFQYAKILVIASIDLLSITPTRSPVLTPDRDKAAAS